MDSLPFVIGFRMSLIPFVPSNNNFLAQDQCTSNPNFVCRFETSLSGELKVFGVHGSRSFIFNLPDAILSLKKTLPLKLVVPGEPPPYISLSLKEALNVSKLS